MKHSDSDQPSDLTNSCEEGDAPEPPWLTILAFLSVPVLTLVSLPLVRGYVERQIASSNASDAGRFGGLAIAAGAVFAATIAALLGLVLAFLADKKREPWLGLRIVAWLINGIVAILGVFIVLTQLIRGL